MLKNGQTKWLFLTTYATLICLQIYSAWHNQLFGDEAFYWLESQHLAWSYAELPGWTQWTIALSQWLLPQHEFTVRLPSLIAAWSLPWLGMLMSRKITQDDDFDFWKTGLLLMTIPLLAVAGTMAIPDIWLIFFGTLSVLIVTQCLLNNKRNSYILLGVVLAIGINVHVRFWIVVFFSCLVILWQFRTDHKAIKNLIYISFPVMLTGFVPILLFNLQNNFALLSFQLSDRHPWQFQASHFSFFPIQLLVASPLVFWLCIQLIRQLNQLNSIQKSMAFIAVFHWLTYALLGFFSDNLRFNAHWTVFSYVLLLVVVGSIPTQQKLKTWSIITGVISSFGLIIALLYALHIEQPISKINAQITENFRGWNELSQKTNKLIQKGSFDYIVADHFMTLAELKFYAKPNIKISSLSHPSNTKHGREQQLEIMHYMQAETVKKGLLIVEHSGLKLEQMVPFYLAACETLHGIQLIDSLDYAAGVKSYYYFETGGGDCKLPPISYTEIQNQQLIGWVLLTQEQPVKLSIKQNNNSIGLINTVNQSLGSSPLFKSLNDTDYSLGQISTQTPDTGPYQLMIEYPNLTILAPRTHHP